MLCEFHLIHVCEKDKKIGLDRHICMNQNLSGSLSALVHLFIGGSICLHLLWFLPFVFCGAR